uniref:Integrase catalytic domain-containing protein n=1 Tax=Nicotiana tabacum TaxID=4097 RepID=A0A1S4DFQ5_TOBAC|nr:PREDICTED: uncharacterized protein LOC107829210 [Nicotiana tabacum]
MGCLAHLEAYQRPLVKEVHWFASLGVRLADFKEGGVVLRNRVESKFIVEVKEKQYDDPLLVQLKEGIYKHKIMAFSLGMFDGRGSHFTANLWEKSLQGLGTQVNLSTTFHPQTDGQAAQTIQTLKDMLRACLLDLKGIWDDRFPLTKFAYNTNYHASIQTAPFEALYGRRCNCISILRATHPSQNQHEEFQRENLRSIMRSHNCYVDRRYVTDQTRPTQVFEDNSAVYSTDRIHVSQPHLRS